MSAREGFTVSRFEHAAVLPSPNSTQARVTVEIRVHWPVAAGNQRVTLAAIHEVCVEAADRVIDAEIDAK
jgi:hypothetical protein